MLPSITLREYAEMVRRGGSPGVVAIVWRDPDTRQVVFDEFVGGEAVAHKLRNLLSELVSEAELNLNTPQRLNLKNGLKVDVVITDEKTKLQLSRIGVFPSLDEWKIVLRDWPYPVEAEARELTHAGRNYLRAEWDSPMRLFDGMLESA